MDRTTPRNILPRVLGCGICLLLLAAPGIAEDRMRITDAEAKKALVNRVDPAYPPMARQMKISGHVEVEVEINTDGSVDKADVVSGNAILASSCANAVKKWKFTPFGSAGKPMSAVVRLGCTFNL